MGKFLPSEQAAAAILVAQRKFKKSNNNANTDITKMERHTGFTEDNLKSCA